MDIVIEGIRYTADPNKREKNIKDRGIDFIAAIPVFSDPEKISAVDNRKDYGEERIQIIGESFPGILFVVYTKRDHGNTRRIISVRLASKKERALYNSLIGQKG